jgi:hypothetical protein
MTTRTKLYALILDILVINERGSLNFSLFYNAALKQLSDHLPGRAGVNTYKHYYEDEYGCCFGRAQAQNAIHKPYSDSREEQATDYDPEGQHIKLLS